jgi:hypothetical protein
VSNRAKEIKSLMRGLGYSPASASKHGIIWEHKCGARCSTPRSSDSRNAYTDIRQRARKALREQGVRV